MNELLPPQYVNIRSDVVYSLDLSDSLCRTYIRLAGMAWKDKLGKQQNLPPLHEDVLCKILGLKRSSLWGQLQALKKHQLIAWTSQNGVFSIRILPKTVERVQNFGFTVNDDDVADDSKQNPDIDSTTSTTPLIHPIQNSGLVQDALKSWGVSADSPEAQRIAELPSVTPELIHAWGEHFSAVHPPALVPVLLAYQLEHSSQPPRKEKRGGSRSKADCPASPQPALPLESQIELPQSVQDDLAAIGWSGLADEVILAWQQDAACVQAWLDFAIGISPQQVKTSRAALFRSGIRSKQHPPYRIPRHTPENSTDNTSQYDAKDELNDDMPAYPWPEAEFKTRQAWKMAVSQLQMDMPRSTFDTYISEVAAVAFDNETGIFTLGAPNAYTRMFLAERLTSTIQRLLTGILNRSVNVEFICPEAAPCAS